MPTCLRGKFVLVFFLQPRHLVHVKAVEGGADVEKEHAEDERGDQEVQRHAQSKVDVNTGGRAKEAETAEELVIQEVETYLQWERGLDAVPTIVDLREKVEDFRRREVEKTLASLNGITDDQRRAVDIMSQAIVNKLLHAPLVVLKQAAAATGAEDNTIAVARRLFNLDKDLKRPVHGRPAEQPAEKVPGPVKERKDVC